MTKIRGYYLIRPQKIDFMMVASVTKPVLHFVPLIPDFSTHLLELKTFVLSIIATYSYFYSSFLIWAVKISFGNILVNSLKLS